MDRPEWPARWCPRCKEWVTDSIVLSYRQVYGTSVCGLRFKYKHEKCGKKWYHTYDTNVY